MSNHKLAYFANKFCLCVFAGRKEEAINKYPDLSDKVDFFVINDPSGNLKYLDWQLKVLQSGQALEDEIIDVTRLFHRFKDHLKKKDLYQYPPNEFTILRDELFAIEIKKDKKKEQNQFSEAAVACGYKDIYDSKYLKVKHIFNKAASIHYGQGTKWCITMKDRGYFEQYAMSNVVFFFIFDKTLPSTDAFHKIAAAFQRGINNEIIKVDYFNARDDQISWDDVGSSEVPTEELNHIYKIMYQIAEAYPKSPIAKLANGDADEMEMLEILNDKEVSKQSNIKVKIIDKIFEKYKARIPTSVLQRILEINEDTHLYNDLKAEPNFTPQMLDKYVDWLVSREGSSSRIKLKAPIIVHFPGILPETVEKLYLQIKILGHSSNYVHAFLETLSTPSSVIEDIYSSLTDDPGYPVLKSVLPDIHSLQDLKDKNKIERNKLFRRILMHPNTPESVFDQINTNYVLHGKRELSDILLDNTGTRSILAYNAKMEENLSDQEYILYDLFLQTYQRYITYYYELNTDIGKRIVADLKLLYGRLNPKLKERFKKDKMTIPSWVRFQEGKYKPDTEYSDEPV